MYSSHWHHHEISSLRYKFFLNLVPGKGVGKKLGPYSFSSTKSAISKVTFCYHSQANITSQKPDAIRLYLAAFSAYVATVSISNASLYARQVYGDSFKSNKDRGATAIRSAAGTFHLQQ